MPGKGGGRKMKRRLIIKKRLIMRRKLSVSKTTVRTESRTVLPALAPVLEEHFEESGEFAIELHK
jgi:hypothetical protein